MGDVLQFRRKGAPQETPTQAVTFKEFAQAVMANDLSAASKAIAYLLALEPGIATPRAQHFIDKYNLNPGIMMKLMELRTLVEKGANNQSLGALTECFGMDIVESVKTFTHLSNVYGQKK